MANAARIADFDTWRPGYDNARVTVYLAGTTTLATLYSDFGLSMQVSNPVSLISQYDGNGTGYGKFAQPIYVGAPISLLINGTNSTGEDHPPITGLEDEDASLALVTTTRGTAARTLADALDDVISVLAFGEFSGGAGATTSTATLNDAIGAAAAQGGGLVLLPAGTVAINPITLSAGVRLRGKDAAATKLTCQAAAAVITYGGDGAGIEEMTLDGLTAATGSIGIETINKNATVFRNAVVQSFDTGIRAKGSDTTAWRDASIKACTTAGAWLRGDVNSGGGTPGNVLQDFQIIGGSIEDCAGPGLIVECIDRLAQNCRVQGVAFLNNVGPALKAVGARNLTAVACLFKGNTGALTVADGSDASQVAINTTAQLYFRDCVFDGGTANFGGTCLDVQFTGSVLKNVSFNLSVPTNALLLVDCQEDAATTYTGDTTKILRQRSSDIKAQTAGVTTDANPTTAWQYAMLPGETVMVNAIAIARQRNGINTGAFWKAAGVSRPGASLPYSSQSANFTVGSILTGQTSGATARITADSDIGTSGTLTVRDITGTFINGETIQDAVSGVAHMASAITYSDAAVDDVGVTEMRAMGPMGSPYAVDINILGGTVRVQVTGVISTTVEWDVAVELTK